MPNVVRCPFCAEEVLAEARKCKHCGEFLDPVLRAARAPNKAGTAGVLGFALPGAGHIYKGKVGRGLGWTVAIVIGYLCGVIPGLILHVISIRSAMRTAEYEPSPAPPQAQGPSFAGRFLPSTRRQWILALAIIIGLGAAIIADRLATEESVGPSAQSNQTSGPARKASATQGDSPLHRQPGSRAARSLGGMPQPVAPKEEFGLLVRAKEDSWLSISVDGRVVMEGTLAAAQSREVHAHKTVVLKLGNAAAVEVSYNNTVQPPLGRDNEVKTVVFTPEGLQP